MEGDATQASTAAEPSKKAQDGGKGKERERADATKDDKALGELVVEDLSSEEDE